MTTYAPGSYFVTTVPGWAGAAINLGQLAAGSPSRYQHAGIVIDADGTTVEAFPGGARYGHLSAYVGRPLLVCDGPVQAWLHACVLPGDPKGAAVVEAEIRRMVATEARKLVGTPYSALDYVALAALHLHLPSRWVRKRVEKSGHVICSQLVDLAYARAGIHLWTDGRLPGDVMPSDLAAWADDHQGVTA